MRYSSSLKSKSFQMQIYQPCNLSKATIAAAVVACVWPCFSLPARYYIPQDSNAASVLIDFYTINVMLKSERNLTRFCERYERMVLSDDGRTAWYSYTYTSAGNDDSVIEDTARFMVASNTTIYINYMSEPNNVQQVELVYINGDNCILAQLNSSNKAYVLLDNPISEIDSFEVCLGVIHNIKDTQFRLVRDPLKCDVTQDDYF
ncbi:uncharacterized protein LOC144132536 isoform X2 [Amblyomma americanum]